MRQAKNKITLYILYTLYGHNDFFILSSRTSYFGGFKAYDHDVQIHSIYEPLFWA